MIKLRALILHFNQNKLIRRKKRNSILARICSWIFHTIASYFLGKVYWRRNYVFFVLWLILVWWVCEKICEFFYEIFGVCSIALIFVEYWRNKMNVRGLRVYDFYRWNNRCTYSRSQKKGKNKLIVLVMLSITIWLDNWYDLLVFIMLFPSPF